MKIILFTLLLSLQFFNGLMAKECQEQLFFTFDEREWEKGFEEGDKQQFILEYVLKGETVNKWSELVTVQRFLGLNASVNDYYKIFIEELKKSVFPADVHTKILERSSNSMLFEWWIDKESPHAQHEWFKLFQTPYSLFILRYTTKQMDDVEKVRKTWEKNLQNAKVTSDGNCKK